MRAISGAPKGNLNYTPFLGFVIFLLTLTELDYIFVAKILGGLS